MAALQIVVTMVTTVTVVLHSSHTSPETSPRSFMNRGEAGVNPAGSRQGRHSRHSTSPLTRPALATEILGISLSKTSFLSRLFIPMYGSE